MRYLPLLAGVLLVLLSTSPSARADDAAKLKSLTVTFHTHSYEFPGDPKKADTHVQIMLYTEVDSHSHPFARQVDIDAGATFDDPSDKGPYDIKVLEPISKTDYFTSKTGLQIIPTSQEKWRVIVEITATFDDGSTITSKSNSIEMTSSTSAQHFDNKPADDQ